MLQFTKDEFLAQMGPIAPGYGPLNRGPAPPNSPSEYVSEPSEYESEEGSMEGYEEGSEEGSMEGSIEGSEEEFEEMSFDDFPIFPTDVADPAATKMCIVLPHDAKIYASEDHMAATKAFTVSSHTLYSIKIYSKTGGKFASTLLGSLDFKLQIDDNGLSNCAGQLNKHIINARGTCYIVTIFEPDEATQESLMTLFGLASNDPRLPWWMKRWEYETFSGFPIHSTSLLSMLKGLSLKQHLIFNPLMSLTSNLLGQIRTSAVAKGLERAHVIKVMNDIVPTFRHEEAETMAIHNTNMYGHASGANLPYAVIPRSVEALHAWLLVTCDAVNALAASTLVFATLMGPPTLEDLQMNRALYLPDLPNKKLSMDRSANAMLPHWKKVCSDFYGDADADADATDVLDKARKEAQIAAEKRRAKHIAAHDAHEEVERLAAKLVSFKREQRAKNERLARAARKAPEYTKSGQSHRTSGSKAKNAHQEANLVHELHVKDEQRAIRTARFETKQGVEHLEAVLKKARDHATRLTTLASEADKDYQAATHHVPTVATLSAAFATTCLE